MIFDFEVILMIVKMTFTKPNSSKDTVLSSWMGKFDAIYFGEDENNLGTGHFRIDFNRPYNIDQTTWPIIWAI